MGSLVIHFNIICFRDLKQSFFFPTSMQNVQNPTALDVSDSNDVDSQSGRLMKGLSIYMHANKKLCT